jgi:hypothetical protein
MKRILDRLADLELAIPDWSDSAWQILERAATRDSPTRDQVRATALRCARCCQRDAILPYAVESVSRHIPGTVGPEGRQAIADAVTAVLLGDVIAAVSYAVLMAPLHLAVETPRVTRRPRAG